MEFNALIRFGARIPRGPDQWTSFVACGHFNKLDTGSPCEICKEANSDDCR
jgi:hypothetical protein